MARSDPPKYRTFTDPSHQDPIFDMLHKARRVYVGIIGFSFLLNLLFLASPIYMMQVYDRVLTSGQGATLLLLTLIAVTCFSVLGALEAIRSILLLRIAKWLNETLSEGVVRASFSSTLSGKEVGSAPLRDLTAVQNFTSGQAVKSLLDAPWAPIFLVVLWMLHGALAALAIFAGGFIFCLAIINERLTREKTQQGTDLNSQAQDTIAASLRNAEAVEAMGMSAFIIERYKKLNAFALRKSCDAEEKGAIIAGLTKAFRLSVQMAVLGIGALLVLGGEMSPGAMIAASILLSRAIAPLEQSLGAWKQFVVTRVAYKRLSLLLKHHSHQDDAMELPPPIGALSLENVSFTHDKKEPPVLKQISFSINAGEALAIIGPSASGKSSLCRIIAGVWKPTLGTVRLDGADVSRWPRKHLGQYVGYLPQMVELFSGSVRENISRLQKGDPQKVIEAAKIAGVHDVILRLPEGYDTDIGPSGSRLSSGQRQRIGLARALYGNPKLIILDEPNSNLDERGDLALAGALKAVKSKGTTIIIVAHRPAALTCVDYVLLLSNGVVDKFGSRNSVLQELVNRRKGKNALSIVKDDTTNTKQKRELRVV